MKGIPKFIFLRGRSVPFGKRPVCGVPNVGHCGNWGLRVQLAHRSHCAADPKNLLIQRHLLLENNLVSCTSKIIPQNKKELCELIDELQVFCSKNLRRLCLSISSLKNFQIFLGVVAQKLASESHSGRHPPWTPGKTSICMQTFMTPSRGPDPGGIRKLWSKTLRQKCFVPLP